MTPRVAVIGAGWAGATTARLLHDAGLAVEIFEQSDVVGGHSRTEVLNGVVYEPNGAHIFHTSNPEVAGFVKRFGLTRPYEHAVLTEVFVDDADERPYLLSWPPQVDELKQLPVWERIAAELDERPPAPSGADFETYSVSLMGPTLYRLFIRDYTLKQWDRQPSELSSKFAPKRIDLRTDGYRRLFRDRWEFFGPRGATPVIESVLAPVSLTCGAQVTIDDLDGFAAGFDALVITAALDEFCRSSDQLEWRGIRMRSSYHPTEQPGDTMTPAYVVNRPSRRVPYTRTVETKHATGQEITGTVVSQEYSTAGVRHYPVYTVEGTSERRNLELKEHIRSVSPIPTYFCGRLANYQYINQDQAIEQAMACAREVVAAHA